LLKARCLFQDDKKATPPPAEHYVGTLFTKARDEVLHKYPTPPLLHLLQRGSVSVFRECELSAVGMVKVYSGL
jgi:hypothetical protein